MNRARLLGIILIAEDFIAELLACQVEYAVPDDIIAVIISARAQNAVYFAAEDILRQKCRDRALTECRVFGAPLIAQPRRTAFRRPDMQQCIIKRLRCFDAGVAGCIGTVCRNGRLLPAVKMICLHNILLIQNFVH